MPREHIHFVTGKLAEPSLRGVVGELATQLEFDYSISTLGISVAALMTTDWIAARLKPPAETSYVLLPGYCRGELTPLEAAVGKSVRRGPKDLRELPEYFGRRPRPSDYGVYDIEILAEINHAPQMALVEILAAADALRRDGADVIDVGCDPGGPWSGVETCVRALRDAGHRVSIDSMNIQEIAAAARAGAELVLSVHSTNRHAARDWGCEVVAIPDQPATLAGLEETLAVLDRDGVRFRIDPILEPIGFGFAASLGRYLEARRRWPQAPMLMGIGNLTELTDADSAGLNVLLLAFCQELQIRSVLTTQVIPWARTSVKECDLARRLVYHAVTRRVLPKHLEPRLLMLRDPAVVQHTPQELQQLAQSIKDHNIRVFAEADGLHVLTAGVHLQGDDPFDLFEKLLQQSARPIDASHAFYLGYELAKAATALTLGKTYRQDEALTWGFLTREETSHRGRPGQ
jgi:dihydropteroate synthase-like protein